MNAETYQTQSQDLAARVLDLWASEEIDRLKANDPEVKEASHDGLSHHRVCDVL